MLGLTAEQIGTVLLAISLLITGKLAQQKGKDIVSKSPPQEGTMEIAGAVISDGAVDRLVKSMDALAASNTMLTHATNLDTDAKKALTKALEQNSEALDGNTEVSAEVRGDIKEVARDMRTMTAEMIRFQGRER